MSLISKLIEISQLFKFKFQTKITSNAFKKWKFLLQFLHLFSRLSLFLDLVGLKKTCFLLVCLLRSSLSAQNSHCSYTKSHSYDVRVLLKLYTNCQTLKTNLHCTLKFINLLLSKGPGILQIQRLILQQIRTLLWEEYKYFLV